MNCCNKFFFTTDANCRVGPKHTNALFVTLSCASFTTSSRSRGVFSPFPTFRVHLQRVSSNTHAHCNNCKSLQNAQLSSQSSNVSVFLEVAPFGNASNCRSLRQHDAAFTCADLIRVMSQTRPSHKGRWRFAWGLTFSSETKCGIRQDSGPC